MESQYVLHRPPEPLSAYIECFWFVQSGHPALLREKVLPNGVMELIFNLGAAFRVWDRGPSTEKTVRDVWLSGLHKQPIVIEQTGLSRMVGVRFKPGGAYPFLQIPVSEVSGLVIEMELLWGRQWVSDVREQLAELSSLSQKFRLLELQLMKRLTPGPRSSPLTQYATERLIRTGGFVSIRLLAQETGVSPQYLARQFDLRVGLSPKALCRILKFQRVLKEIGRSKTVDWAGVADRCGYFDQAHLIREFRNLSGLTPGQYAGERGEDPNFIQLPKD